MKELNRFRQFLIEGINPNQTIFNINYKDDNEMLEVDLYVAADNFKTAKQMADQYMGREYVDSYKYDKSGSRKLSEPFSGLDPGEQKTFKGNIADFGIDNFA